MSGWRLDYGDVVASKEATGAMSVETGGSGETGVGWGRAVPASRGLLGRRRVLAPGISEVRGPAASMRRDAVFRRMLFAADVFAIVTAFVLTIELSSRTLMLNWTAALAVPVLAVC